MFAFQLQFQAFLHKEEDILKVIFFKKESQVLSVLTASKKKQNITQSWNSQEICQPYDTTTQLHSRIQLASLDFTRPNSLPPRTGLVIKKSYRHSLSLMPKTSPCIWKMLENQNN